MDNNKYYKKFDAFVLEKFRKESFEKLTYIQEQSYRAIIRRQNSLIVAPTGSGKTEAAILPVISMISFEQQQDGQKRSGTKCLYITPQRSLNNDVFRRIIKYAESENLRVDIRHGDTPYSKRKKIYECPPDILITTPESLAIILVNEKMIPILKSLEWIVIDEVHELLPSKRGSYLSLCLQRLYLISNSFCIIGISATIGNLEEASRFISGEQRKCAVLLDKTLRKYDIDIKHMDGSTINEVSGFILNLVKEQYSSSSILLFTNTRDESEFIGTVLKNQNNIPIHIHHGSLSKEVREETENLLRSGFVGIVVCTSSLELGLDIGSIDLVIHYGSPRQVSKLIQRIGRSKHTRRSSAKGMIITNTFDDFMESIGIVKRVNKGSIEVQPLHIGALDVLAHNVIGATLQIKQPLPLGKLFDLFKSSYSFHSISFLDFLDCINLLSITRLLKYDEEKQTIARSGKSYRYYYENVSTIPYVVKFEVIDSISKKRIGSLDQQFVGDYGEKGNVFVLKGSQWRILIIDENKLQVHVEPLSGAPINVPYWVGEMIPVDYDTAKMVGIAREKLFDLHKSSQDNFFPPKFDLLFLKKLSEKLKSIKIIPNAKNIVIESVLNQNIVVIHSTFGSKINNTLSSLLSTFISSKMGYMIETRSDPYRILLSSNNVRLRKNHFLSLFEDEFDVESVLIASFLGTYNINWKVWGVAKRFGLISKESVYDKKIARIFYEKYHKTSISKESIRELIHDKYDIEKTTMIIAKIKSEEIVVHWFEKDEFSELAQSILAHAKKSISAPLNIESGVLELIKERLSKTKHKLICIRCGKWERMYETKDIPENIRCPFCKSKLIAATFWSDMELKNIIARKLQGSSLSKEEENKFDRAWKIASLINNFGKLAIFVLSGHGIGADTCARILRNYVDDGSLLKTIYETEKQYVMTRGFWNT
ncbi:MAG TPA: DEAD/DEAH box helicase [Candidatus Sulfopaludibacter sp.]|nr:DEAD/DEAH box helicase [Candidatus Sulfopaludibacter sp.]